jgi:predicted HicB family RNase H-like nuclease
VTEPYQRAEPFLLKCDLDLSRRIAATARHAGLSFPAWVVRALEEAVQRAALA